MLLNIIIMEMQLLSVDAGNGVHHRDHIYYIIPHENCEITKTLWVFANFSGRNGVGGEFSHHEFAVHWNYAAFEVG